MRLINKNFQLPIYDIYYLKLSGYFLTAPPRNTGKEEEKINLYFRTTLSHSLSSLYTLKITKNFMNEKSYLLKYLFHWLNQFFPLFIINHREYCLYSYKAITSTNCILYCFNIRSVSKPGIVSKVLDHFLVLHLHFFLHDILSFVWLNYIICWYLGMWGIIDIIECLVTYSYFFRLITFFLLLAKMFINSNGNHEIHY